MWERLFRSGTFVVLLFPFLLLCRGVSLGELGPDPAERIMHVTGEWGVRALALCLTVRPLGAWLGVGWLIRLRRMLGLYAFFYATVHLVTFAHFYAGWIPALALEELLERPYITVGFAAWLAMLPLALTSTRGMQRRLKRNWRRLHRLVFPAAGLICAHILWQARSDVGEALLYIAVFLLLGLWRLWPVLRRSLVGVASQ